MKQEKEEKWLRIGVLDTPIINSPNKFNHLVSVRQTSREKVDSFHGNICVALIDQLIAKELKVEIYCISVLDKHGCGNLEKILEAINWCSENHINVINMSLGSLSMRDYGPVRKAVVSYMQGGGLVIAAKNNTGKYSLPADIFPVVGVSCQPSVLHSWLGGLEMIWDDVPPELTIAGIKHKIMKSNSYAAAVVTSYIINEYYEYILSKGFSVKNFLNYIWKKVRSRETVQPFLPEYIVSEEVKQNDFNKNQEFLCKTAYTLIIMKEDDIKKINFFDNKIYNIILLCEMEHMKRIQLRKAFGAFFWDIAEYEKIIHIVGCIRSTKNEYPCINIQLDECDMKKVVGLQKFIQNEGYNVKLCTPYSKGLLHELFYVPTVEINNNICDFFCKTFNLDMFVYVDHKNKTNKNDLWDLNISMESLRMENFSVIIKNIEKTFNQNGGNE